MELKEIEIKNIKPNLSQPRETFDKQRVQELAESIMSNGLINPISVREEKGKYIVVAGERRFQAHKMSGIKKISAFVRTYKNDADWMVESFVENVHREDITPTEKGRYLSKIKEMEKIESIQALSKRVNSNRRAVESWLDDFNFRSATRSTAGHTMIRSTQGLEEKERKELIEWAGEKDISARKMDEVIVPAYKQADEGAKAALLSEYERTEEDPEPIIYERTANDVVDDILSNLHNFKHNVDELLKDMNVEDISRSKANKAITTAGLHLREPLRNFVNTLRQRGATPDKLILALIKANAKS